ncbi:MAG TPA: PIN domain-containing protein [Anaerolineales bacterium]|nr:PIN domain-containing protein [Anaerolineales bacterium]
MEALRFAKSFVSVNDEIESRSRELINQGFQALDALHLASAESADVDFLCTTDDKLLKRARSVKNIKIKIVSPTELIEEVEK